MMLKVKESLKDPMIVVLTLLLVFLTCGCLFAGCMRSAKLIAIDAAYGGDNTGYQGIINEADFNEAVVEKLVALLEEDSRFHVLLTHEASESSSVQQRAEKINASKADLVLSIHASGTPDATKSGQIVYADIPTKQTHAESLKFADSIKQQFTSDTWLPTTNYLYYKPLQDDSYQLEIINVDDTTDYGYETWSLMELCEAPVVISDQIYVTNQDDINTWANEDGYTKSAQLYYDAIKEYYGIEE